MRGDVTNTTTYFERGFKSWCENTAVSIRSRLGLSKFESLDPWLLAQHLKVAILFPSNIPGLTNEVADYLKSSDGDEWSAVTIIYLGITVVVINQNHSVARQSTDIMHELAHLIRAHQPVQHFTNDSGFVIRSFNKSQEDEADWLAATLLLPRTALFQIARSHYDIDQVCSEFKVSKMLLKYRLNVTGLARQYPVTN